MNNILIVSFGGLGDILNATPIAKHYKLENSENNVSFLTREKYKFVVQNNKFIDNIYCMESPTLNNVKMSHCYKSMIEEEFRGHKIIFSAPYMSPKYDGTARSTLLKIIKNECVDIENWNCEFVPNIGLSEDEIKEAQSFFNTLNGKKKILLEYENFSEQSPYDKSFFYALCDKINNKNYDLILTGLKEPEYLEFAKNKYNINFYHYNRSFMSNAELYNLCDMFVGCCSGITCLTSSEYCVTDKTRIEICRGEHWSSVDWTHNNQNKYICYDFNSFSDVLSKVD